jgi:hypothetical protein
LVYAGFTYSGLTSTFFASVEVVFAGLVSSFFFSGLSIVLACGFVYSFLTVSVLLS